MMTIYNARGDQISPEQLHRSNTDLRCLQGTGNVYELTAKYAYHVFFYSNFVNFSRRTEIKLWLSSAFHGELDS